MEVQSSIALTNRVLGVGERNRANQPGARGRWRRSDRLGVRVGGAARTRGRGIRMVRRPLSEGQR